MATPILTAGDLIAIADRRALALLRASNDCPNGSQATRYYRAAAAWALRSQPADRASRPIIAPAETLTRRPN